MTDLYVVGIGPGSISEMTYNAVEVLKKCDVIVGYTVYADLMKAHFPDKEYVTTPMRKETERVKLALDMAAEGKKVAVICSGDAGIYGMSGLCFEMAQGYDDINIQVVSGISAVISGSGLLGAPLMHDFSVISLSDLLTPWEKIEKRLHAAASADFVICLYNPSSMKRHDYLMKACDIVLQYQSAETVCGIARNIGREGEEAQVLTLGELRDTQVDMFSTVFIGNSQTREINGKMITPRGYKYE